MMGTVGGGLPGNVWLTATLLRQPLPSQVSWAPEEGVELGWPHPSSISLSAALVDSRSCTGGLIPLDRIELNTRGALHSPAPSQSCTPVPESSKCILFYPSLGLRIPREIEAASCFLTPLNGHSGKEDCDAGKRSMAAHLLPHPSRMKLGFSPFSDQTPLASQPI